MFANSPDSRGRTATLWQVLLPTLLASTVLMTSAKAQEAQQAQPAAPAPDPYLELVDPELRPMLAVYGPTMDMTEERMLQLRKELPVPPPLDDMPFYEKQIKGLEGEPDVSIIVVNAKPGKSRPGILHTHGGGHVLFTAKQYLPLLQTLAKEIDVTFVTVDYRLAPETTYKGSVSDNYAGLKWLHDNAAELGVDTKRLAVMGESAGGTHAALLAIEARNRGEVPLVLQVLTFPMLDDRTGSSRTPAPNAGKLVWTANSNVFGWGAFLGQEPGTDSVPAAAVPARTENLAGLAPAFITVGDIDLFAEEDVEYGLRLIRAGVPVELHVFPGGYHGFNFLVPDAVMSKQFLSLLYTALRRGLNITE
jgi:acetyl esterase/lipase